MNDLLDDVKVLPDYSVNSEYDDSTAGILLRMSKPHVDIRQRNWPKWFVLNVVDEGESDEVLIEYAKHWCEKYLRKHDMDWWDENSPWEVKRDGT
jgi:hypothetical protein